MITPELFFKNLEEIYKVAFENFKFVSEQQKKFIDLWLSQQPESFKEAMEKPINEWYNNMNKAMEDFKDLVFKGIEYLKETYQKNK